MSAAAGPAGPPLIVLDDDPTGTQAMADVPVLLRWDDERLAQIVDGGARVIHLITNSRALPPGEAYDLVAGAARTVAEVVPEAEVILRGDSTLRGHLLEEYRALQEVRFPGRFPVLLLVPALPPAGRITVDGVHLLERGGQRIPLHETEYAQDPSFSYRDSRLLAWAQERSGGFFAAEAGREVRLDELRGRGADAVGDALGSLADGPPAVCAADAETVDDLERVAAGLRTARADGVEVVVRCAPTFAGVLGGSLAHGTVTLPAVGGPVLVVCGSYVPTSTRQLAALVDAHPGSLVEADVLALASPEPEREIERLAATVSDRLDAHGVGVLATPRHRPPGADGLDVQRRIAANFAAVLGRLRTRPAVVIAKGGVTSAVTASAGLGATSAHVVGPLVDGVGLWRVPVPRPDSGPGGALDGDHAWLPYVVVPGNVGEDDLLVRLVDMAGPDGRVAGAAGAGGR